MKNLYLNKNVDSFEEALKAISLLITLVLFARGEMFSIRQKCIQ